MMKIWVHCCNDMGCHITGKAADVIAAVNTAVEVALRLVRPGRKMSEAPGISAFEDNIFIWKGTICGSKDITFEGTEYKLSLQFPVDYPFKSPNVKFKTMCFHPIVDVCGNICLDILQLFGFELGLLAKELSKEIDSRRCSPSQSDGKDTYLSHAQMRVLQS